MGTNIIHRHANDNKLDKSARSDKPLTDHARLVQMLNHAIDMAYQPRWNWHEVTTHDDRPLALVAVAEQHSRKSPQKIIILPAQQAKQNMLRSLGV